MTGLSLTSDRFDALAALGAAKHSVCSQSPVRLDTTHAHTRTMAAASSGDDPLRYQSPSNPTEGGPRVEPVKWRITQNYSLHDIIQYAVIGAEGLPEPDEVRRFLERHIKTDVPANVSETGIKLLKMFLSAWLSQYALLRRYKSRLRKLHESQVGRLVEALGHGWSIEEYSQLVVRAKAGRLTPTVDITEA